MRAPSYRFALMLAAAIGVVGTPAQARDLPIGRLSDWFQTYNPSFNPTFSAKEVPGGIETRASGSSLAKCENKWIRRTWVVPTANSSNAVLTMVADFGFNGTQFNMPAVEIELSNGNAQNLGTKRFFGQGVIGSYNREMLVQTGYIELGSAIGTHVIPLSQIKPNVIFTTISVSLMNYACIGENSITLSSLSLSGVD